MSDRIRDLALDFLEAPVGVPEAFRSATPEVASGLLKVLGESPGYRDQALQRGTACAKVNIVLSQRAAGSDAPSDEMLDRMAAGHGPTKPLRMD